MNRQLLDSINGLAKKTWLGNDKITDENMDEWYKHWIKCGRTIANNFRRENLHITAKYIDDFINGEEKGFSASFVNNSKEREFKEARNSGEFIGFDKTLFLKMIGMGEIEGKTWKYNSKQEEWSEWWSNLSKETRKQIALQVEMAFGREAYQNKD